MKLTPHTPHLPLLSPQQDTCPACLTVCGGGALPATAPFIPFTAGCPGDGKESHKRAYEKVTPCRRRFVRNQRGQHCTLLYVFTCFTGAEKQQAGSGPRVIKVTDAWVLMQSFFVALLYVGHG